MTRRVEPSTRNADVRVIVTVADSVSQRERDALDQEISEAVARVLDGRHR